ncbi:type VI secretion system-associated FHA domain protein TagH [Mesorhizobium sp. LHD-90]|uniref:type VI secretion system-associated FHA domain protein TagH n=1 Tax=Mesorhizobium sp. LHD-90 TaxID=3071414 RepID=UPI0027E00DFA|nr:type VI secretion system-associated FHA domain protein TagH [Mesorhizobium sp. LHD-90]MDQ6434721.1 type VI secretion system-associated FHA domain protein TagH [Mesorhizobium sp. LHD-90]
MTIKLTIDSVDSLPDGGPITFQARNRGFEIGRQQHLDWTLPDPSRYISGLHCDVRFEKGGYWLYDVSRNGTFLNGSTARMKSPHRLTTGDRLAIGHYIVSVEVDGPGGAASYQPEGTEQEPPARSFSTPSDDIWGTGEPAPPPIDRRELAPEPANRRRAADFSNQFLEFPDVLPSAGAEPASRDADRSPPPPARPAPAYPESPFGQPQAPAAPGFEARPPAFQPAEPPAPRPRPAHAANESFSSGPAPVAAAPAAPAPFAAQPFPPVAPVQAGVQDAAARFLQGLAAGAGVPPETFAARDPGEVGNEIGEFLKTTVEHLAQLLRARAAAKAMTKSASRTMIGATDNNPLKFIPGTPEIIDVMFTRRRPGFLGAKGSLDAGFADLKRHELATYAAMQKALSRLLDDISPEAISAKVGSSAFSSKKSRSWDLFEERWEQKSAAHENGMLDVFLAYFAEAYDEASKKG